jgi:phospholipid/cholesterol/gamma-HCH transport system substrate-binding protein
MSEITRKRQIAVGVFIFVGLVILVGGIFTIGNQHKAFVSTIRIKAVFDDVQGLQPGNNVWLSGMKVGTVKQVSFFGVSQVEIIMNIEKQAQPHIRKDMTVRISTDGLVGNKIVVISGGTPEAPAIQNNDQLAGEHLAGTQEMLTTLQASGSNLLAITGNLKAVSQKLSSGQGTLGSLINDPSIAEQLRASIDNFRATAAGSERMMANLEGFSAALHKPGGLAQELVSDTTVFLQLKSTAARLNEAASQATAFSVSLRSAGEGLNDPNTPLGTLLHNEEAADDLQRTIKNLRVSSKELSDDLEAVQHSFLLRGFFKKREKQ